MIWYVMSTHACPFFRNKKQNEMKCTWQICCVHMYVRKNAYICKEKRGMRREWKEKAIIISKCNEQAVRRKISSDGKKEKKRNCMTFFFFFFVFFLPHAHSQGIPILSMSVCPCPTRNASQKRKKCQKDGKWLGPTLQASRLAEEKRMSQKMNRRWVRLLEHFVYTNTWRTSWLGTLWKVPAPKA